VKQPQLTVSATVRLLTITMWLQCFQYVMSLAKDYDHALSVFSGEKTYEVLSESSWTVIVVTALVKVDKGRPRSDFCKPIASVYHVTPGCEHALFLHKCFFDIMFCFVCNGWQNRATCLHQVLCEAQ
jgi:hypothetical protein